MVGIVIVNVIGIVLIMLYRHPAPQTVCAFVRLCVVYAPERTNSLDIGDGAFFSPLGELGVFCQEPARITRLGDFPVRFALDQGRIVDD